MKMNFCHVLRCGIEKFHLYLRGKILSMNKHIFDEIQSLKRQLIPDDRLILFGSQARDDARENSDWDLLAILNSDKRSWRNNFNQYVYPFSEIV